MTEKQLHAAKTSLWPVSIAVGCLALFAIPPVVFGAFMLILHQTGMDWERQVDGGNVELLILLSIPPLAALFVVAWLIDRRRARSLADPGHNATSASISADH